MREVNDKYFWNIVLVNIMFLVIQLGFQYENTIILLIYIGTMMVLSTLDVDEIELSGRKSFKWYWILIPFLYLIRRWFALKDRNTILGTFLIFIAYAGSLAYASDKEHKAKEMVKEAAYCNTVTKLFKQSNLTAGCLKVVDVQQITSVDYRGIALMSDGGDYKFTVKWLDNDRYLLDSAK